MVDFQSRDTSRAVGDDGDDDAEPPEEADAEPDHHDEGDSHDDADTHDEEHGHEHDHHAHDRDDLGVAVVTISESRSRESDASGDAIEAAITEAGHEVVSRDVIRDDFDGVQSAVDALTNRGDVDVVVTTGGTGVTPDDVTIEAVAPLFEKDLPGFGELFRLLSYEEIGTKVVGTRATAGVADNVVVFCLPGSVDAVELGTSRIIVEEAPHLVGLAQRE